MCAPVIEFHDAHGTTHSVRSQHRSQQHCLLIGVLVVLVLAVGDGVQSPHSLRLTSRACTSDGVGLVLLNTHPCLGDNVGLYVHLSSFRVYRSWRSGRVRRGVGGIAEDEGVTSSQRGSKDSLIAYLTPTRTRTTTNNPHKNMYTSY